MTNYSWPGKVYGPGKGVCVCVSWCCSRQMKAPRSWRSSYSIIQTSASILSLSPLHILCTHTRTHTWTPRVHMTLPPSASCTARTKTSRHKHTHTSNLWHASRRALQVQRKWSRWDKDGRVSVMLQSATGDKKVTQPITVYSYSSPSCQLHGSTLALSTYLVEKVVKLTRSGKINVCNSQM